MSDITSIFDWLSVFALAFLSYGVAHQWLHIYRTKSTHDIDLREVSIRFAITWVILIKIFLVGDIYLIAGQLIFGLTITIYFFTLLALRSRKHR